MNGSQSMRSDLKDLREKSYLEPKLWSRNGKLNPKVRVQLLKVAKDFFDGLGLSKDVLLDVQITGSLASMTWSKHSDLDLHVILDFSRIPADEDISERYFDAVKNLWNEQHRVLIKDYEVEIYVEDAEHQHVSNGLYSLVKGAWLEIPVRETNRSFDDMDVISKAQRWMRMVETEVFQPFAMGDHGRTVESAGRMSKRFKKWRQCGLDSNGISSVENLAYKLLRRRGYLDAIKDLSRISYDALASVD